MKTNKLINLYCALRGVFISFKEDFNMKFYAIAVILVILAGIFGKIEPWAWCCVYICFSLVISAELFNSAIERICNRTSNGNYEPIIRDIKDIAAGGVLISAIISVVVAVFVFLRPQIIANFTSFLAFFIVE